MIDLKVYPQPFMVGDLVGHDDIKDELLAALKDMPDNSINNESGIITKCDWHTDEGSRSDVKEEPTYWKILFPYIHDFACACMQKIGIEYFRYGEPWFQQYFTNDCHDWHMHPGSMFNMIYYVELPEDGPQTVFQNPIDSSQILEVGAKEGQVAIFPAILKHRSPPSTSKGRKTIIATNLD